ncbi:MAPEG family protein [Phenylobacterium sp.]|uniref:MAPEG family protein n=1 Tax=Phenylobacterium sp. TaxID=1871053 RepID=UPI002731762F|nr:MAPEG family protein [Phenylobacterium sp.]MDP1598789.1 MAPEG family protein [Phenylobacterium sp.]MDP3590562.1 MAPEG family protein [Phenylobacterium sp.]
MAMAVELKLLGAAVIIGMVQLLWAAAASRRQQGLEWAAGSRDEARPVTGVAARLNRSFANFMETFPLFAAAVVTAYLAAKLGPLTLWGSVLYVVSRVLHPIAYMLNVPYLRSLIWFVGFGGALAVIAAIFL